MAEAAATAGVVRVGVVCDARRADVAVPAVLPVAVLLGQLVELLGPAVAGRRLLTLDGEPLDPELGLVEQRVPTGSVLVLVDAGDQPPVTRIGDDPADVVADAVAAQPAWGASARSAAAGLLVVPAVAVAVLAAVRAPSPVTGRWGGGPPAPSAAVAPLAVVAVVAVVVLLGLAAVAARGPRPGAAVPAAYVASLLAAAAAAGRGFPVGAVLLVCGLAAAAAVGRRWPLVLPVAVVGSALAVVDAVAAATGEVVPALALAATAVVVLGGLAPGPALALAGWSPAPLRTPWVEEPDPCAGDRGGDVPRAAELVAGVVGGGGLLLVGAAPVLAASGPAAALLAGTLGAHLVLRSRRARSARLVLLDLAPGAATLAAVAATLVLVRPTVAPWLLGVSVVVVVALLVLPVDGGPRRRRLADLTGTGTLLAVPALLVAATGLPGVVGRAVGDLAGG